LRDIRIKLTAALADAKPAGSKRARKPVAAE
jgi:hypothetical protein